MIKSPKNLKPCRPALVSGKYLTRAYLAALGLIALLTVASHVTLVRVLAEHEGSAAIVNASGRQRMLSQRIASLVAQYEMGSATAKKDLLDSLLQFESAHHKLLTSLKLGNTYQSSSVVFSNLYYGGERPLDGEVTNYVQLARLIAARPPGIPFADRALQQIFSEAQAPLLAHLDAVVHQHQHDSEQQLGLLEKMQNGTLFVVLLTLITEALIIFRPMVKRITRYARELVKLANTDPLTGLLNRQSFLEQGEVAITRAQRHSAPVSVMMVDADEFKKINDTFGHSGGDAALVAFSQALITALRPEDLVGRLGGEEFAVVLTDVSETMAIYLAEQLRAAVEKLTLTYQGQRIRLTISIGLASVQSGQLSDLPSLLDDADRYLYHAKALGRNRVVASEPILVAI